MGHIFSYNDARNYDRWINAPRNRPRYDFQTRLMERMLDPAHRDSLLDIGCGTGQRLTGLLERNLQVTGLDPSPHMLELADRTLGSRVDLHRGVAEELPFDDNAFNYAIVVDTLEFVDHPEKTLEEAFRVAKDRVFIGIINRHSRRAGCLRAQRFFTRTVYSEARFFTVWEIKRMVRALLGDVPLQWRTHLACPNPLRWLPRRPPWLNVAAKSPLGPFIGISVILTPRFRTRLIPLKCHAKPVGNTISGLAAGVNWRQRYGSLSL